MPDIDWPKIIDEAVGRTSHMDSATAAGLEIPVDRQVMERWRKGERGTPRGRVKVALERWARLTLPAKDQARLGLTASREGGASNGAPPGGTHRSAGPKKKGRRAG